MVKDHSRCWSRPLGGLWETKGPHLDTPLLQGGAGGGGGCRGGGSLIPEGIMVTGEMVS